jgi:hypothetical protein
MSYLNYLKESISVSRYTQSENDEELELTLEDLAWGCKAALLELNNDDPVLYEQVKLTSNKQILNLLFENDTKFLFDALTPEQQALVKKSIANTKKEINDEINKDKFSGGYEWQDKLLNKYDNMSKSKQAAVWIVSGLLQVAIVSAIAYGVYKYLKARKGKKVAAEAAAKKSDQLAKKARSQGNKKAAEKAQQNAKMWRERAKNYKAKGE